MKHLAFLAVVIIGIAGPLWAQFDSLRQGDRIKREANPVPGASLVQGHGTQWLGCWTITMHDTVARRRESVVVRLDSTRAHSRAAWQSYYGARLEDLSRDSMARFSVLWGIPAEDSLDVWLIGLGGTGWRLGKSGDSLVGGAYHNYDLIPTETALGPASARRRSCP